MKKKKFLQSKKCLILVVSLFILSASFFTTTLVLYSEAEKELSVAQETLEDTKTRVSKLSVDVTYWKIKDYKDEYSKNCPRCGNTDTHSRFLE